MIESIAIGILTFVIIALLVDRFINSQSNSEERMKMLNAIIAKNTNEFHDLEAARTTSVAKEEPKLPDLTPVEDLTDDEFGDIING